MAVFVSANEMALRLWRVCVWESASVSILIYQRRRLKQRHFIIVQIYYLANHRARRRPQKKIPEPTVSLGPCTTSLTHTHFHSGFFIISLFVCMCVWVCGIMSCINTKSEISKSGKDINLSLSHTHSLSLSLSLNLSLSVYKNDHK